jgi:ABC-2 type transport system permease protein
MNKQKYIFIGVLVLLLLGVLGIFKFRIDLTQENRYTLSENTIKVLESVKKPMLVDVQAVAIRNKIYAGRVPKNKS